MMQIQGKLSHLKKKKKKSFPGSPVIKNPRFHSRGHEFTNSIPAQGTKIPECMPGGVTKKKKNSHSRIHLDSSLSVFSFPSPMMI